MGVGSNNSHWSQTNDIHLEDHEFEVDEEGEGIVNAPKGRAGNYTTNDDKLHFDECFKLILCPKYHIC